MSYVHRKSVEPIRPWCLEVFIESPLTCPLIRVLLSHGLGCAAQKWGLPSCPVPPWQSFFPVFPVPKWRCLSVVPALVISKRIICLHNSDKCVGDPTKTQYYVAVRITVGKVIVGSCVRNLEVDLIAPRNVKIRSSGARVRGDWHYISMRSFYCIIPDSSCLSSMRIARHRCVCDITRLSPSSPFSVSFLQNFESSF